MYCRTALSCGTVEASMMMDHPKKPKNKNEHVVLPVPVGVGT